MEGGNISQSAARAASSLLIVTGPWSCCRALDTVPGPSGDLAWTLPGHCLVKLTSFLDDGDEGVIGQVRLLMLVLLNKLSVRN